MDLYVHESGVSKPLLEVRTRRRFPSILFHKRYIFVVAILPKATLWDAIIGTDHRAVEIYDSSPVSFRSGRVKLAPLTRNTRQES
jgi:hypothetical protein